MDKKQLLDEIQDTYFTLAFDYDYDKQEPKGLGSKKKDDLVKILIKLREEYFKIDEHSKTHIENNMTKREFDDAHQAELSLEEVLSLDIYKLSADVLAREEYSEPLVVDFNL
jgi:hypothetical protein